MPFSTPELRHPMHWEVLLTNRKGIALEKLLGLPNLVMWLQMPGGFWLPTNQGKIIMKWKLYLVGLLTLPHI